MSNSDESPELLPEIPSGVILEAAMQMFLKSSSLNREKDWDYVGEKEQEKFILLAEAAAPAIQKEAVKVERAISQKLEDKISWFQSELQGVKVDLEDIGRSTKTLQAKVVSFSEDLEKLSSDLSLAGEKPDWRLEVERIQEEMLKLSGTIRVLAET